MNCMSNGDFLNSYTEEDHNRALNYQNVYVSHTADYKASPYQHAHNSCELLFIEKGRAEYNINNMKYNVGAGSVLIIGGTDFHSRKFTETPCIRYGLTVMPSYLRTLPIINSYMNVYCTHSTENARRLCSIDETIFQRMIQIVLQIREETKDSGDGRGDMTYALLLEMTILLKRLLLLHKQDIKGNFKAIYEIKDYIDLHYSERLSLDELSRLFFLQPNTISRNFGRIFGKNVNSYIHSVRITNAVRILEESNISITDLADMIGYSSINTFLRQFHEKVGISPLQYRKQFKQFMDNYETVHLLP